MNIRRAGQALERLFEILNEIYETRSEMIAIVAIGVAFAGTGQVSLDAALGLGPRRQVVARCDRVGVIGALPAILHERGTRAA